MQTFVDFPRGNIAGALLGDIKKYPRPFNIYLFAVYLTTLSVAQIMYVVEG
jgi:hypothetical protein